LRRRNLILGLGGVIAAPRVILAQQKPVPVIGYLHFGSAEPFAYQAAAFRAGLSEIGYVNGQNANIEYRWAEGHNERLPGLAEDLVSRQVAVIAAIGPPSALADKNATSTIPVVFAAGIDPVSLVWLPVSPDRAAISPASVSLSVI
jgi:putative ABC transport system substrate-binding protein